MDAKKGTTTVGIVGRDYVILAADKLASMGDLEADRRTQKVYPISDHMAMTTAGLVGDAQLLVRFLKTKINRMKIEEGKEPSGKRVATLLGTILNSTKYMPYMVQLLLGSYVEEPIVYSIDAAGGIGYEKRFTATGSGSPVAYGALEAGYKEGMSEKEAIKLAIRAVETARRRNVFTGGEEPGIDVAVINKDGVRMLTEEEVAKIKKSL